MKVERLKGCALRGPGEDSHPLALRPLSSTHHPSPITLRRSSGFTLIELLIVTVVIVSLMAIVFRLTGIAGSATKKELTVARMQRLENCLSGYYAVFGSYPPVPLQGASRDIYRKAAPNGRVQYPDADPETDSELKWDNVNAACRAQPVRTYFPPAATFGGGSSGDYFDRYQNDVKQAMSDGIYTEDQEKGINNWINATISDLNKNSGQYDTNPGKNEKDFNILPLFRYGVMSFLLPRYRFMIDCMKGDNGKYKGGGFKPGEYAQWKDYNPLPPRMDSGIPYESWTKFAEDAFGKNEYAIDMVPSQGACARWLPNLVDPADPHMVTGKKIKAFGLEIGDDWIKPDIEGAANFYLPSPRGYESAHVNGGHPLFFITMCDGWSRDFYYYSPAPYQTYVVWSAGQDGKTFPPWVDMTTLNSTDYKTAIDWMADDIKSMSTGK